MKKPKSLDKKDQSVTQAKKDLHNAQQKRDLKGVGEAIEKLKKGRQSAAKRRG